MLDLREKVYISGKITGTKNYLWKFARVERKLKRAGYIPYNPAKINKGMPKETNWYQYMEVSMVVLRQCGSIFMMDGWTDSKGETMEREEAIKRRMKIYDRRMFEREKRWKQKKY